MIRNSLLLALATATLVAAPDGGAKLWYDKPSTKWTEALPVGNGSLGGMIFGGADKERIRFNEQTLWTGDEINVGNYQPFGDLFIESPDLANAAGWKDGLLTNATISSTKGGVAKININGKLQTITLPALGKQTIKP